MEIVCVDERVIWLAGGTGYCFDRHKCGIHWFAEALNHVEIVAQQWGGPLG